MFFWQFFKDILFSKVLGGPQPFGKYPLCYAAGAEEQGEGGGGGGGGEDGQAALAPRTGCLLWPLLDYSRGHLAI